ncbi:uracil-DNA glycosylase [Candidatus Nomurabacteria bacterium]|nr:uracil-DNA glycosylase [Candidatus Nomurabacteria bacterium]
MQKNLGPTWNTLLEDEFRKDYFENLAKSLSIAYKNKTIYPAEENIFNAFKLCPFDKVKVVILGQDPYHGERQAHGLAFSVPDKIKIPPSLRNIYKEIASDIGKEVPESGNLEHWAKQGVLLLNATLTVPAGTAGGHQGLGWETFTDEVIKTISNKKDHVVFLLWGNFARSKAEIIDQEKHLILEAPHPSPFSAHTGFFDCNHFSQTNEYLRENNLSEIFW